MRRKGSVELALACFATSLSAAAACPKFFVRCEEPRSVIERFANRLGVPTRDFGLGFAMVVGVADYPGLRGPAGLPLPASQKYLHAAAKDIEKLAAFLQQGEFAEIVVLKDRDVTLENLAHFLQAYFPEKLRKVPNSRFLFAYTGHGFERKFSGGGTRSYVLTSAATSLEDMDNSIEMGMVRRMLDEVADAAQHTLVLFNACYGGAFLDQAFGPSPISLTGKGAHAITAGGIGQKVFHIREVGEGSLFFEKVLEGLRGQADRYGLSPTAGPDGIITKTELLVYLESATRHWAEQSPQSGDLLRGKSLGQFFFYVPGRTPDRALVRELSKKPAAFGGPEDRWLEAKEFYRSGQYEEAYPLLHLEVKAGNVEAVPYLAYMFNEPKNGSRPRALNREMVTIVQYEQRRRGGSGSPGG